jgi:hypothetical protein
MHGMDNFKFKNSIIFSELNPKLWHLINRYSISISFWISVKLPCTQYQIDSNASFDHNDDGDEGKPDYFFLI